MRRRSAIEPIRRAIEHDRATTQEDVASADHRDTIATRGRCVPLAHLGRIARVIVSVCG
jgi:hypothetical protein